MGKETDETGEGSDGRRAGERDMRMGQKCQLSVTSAVPANATTEFNRLCSRQPRFRGWPRYPRAFIIIIIIIITPLFITILIITTPII